jgi:vacuolar-type H+-ATPase subunit H
MTCADSPPADDDAILAVCLTAALYHGAVAEKPAPGRSRAGATAQHVATIIQAAEDAAQAMRTEAEQRVNQRIAEGERAAQYRVQAAEEEAVEIAEAAQEEAARLRRDSQAQFEQAKTTATSEALTIVANAQEHADAAVKQASEAAEASRQDSERRSRELLLDARAAADGVRAEGLELVGNLRQMGDSLRSNAERLLQDVQLIHTRMVATLDNADSPAGTPVGSSRPGDGRPSRSSPTSSLNGPRSSGRAARNVQDEVDVPEFIPPA